MPQDQYINFKCLDTVKHSLTSCHHDHVVKAIEYTFKYPRQPKEKTTFSSRSIFVFSRKDYVVAMNSQAPMLIKSSNRDW